jgi:mRNA interferase HigB
MRLIAKSTLVEFYAVHPETKSAIERWHSLVKNGTWNSSAEIQAAFSNAVVLNGERVRFEIAGGNYRLIAAFDFKRRVAFVKFLGTHAEYDKVDALTVSMF